MINLSRNIPLRLVTVVAGAQFALLSIPRITVAAIVTLVAR